MKITATLFALAGLSITLAAPTYPDSDSDSASTSAASPLVVRLDNKRCVRYIPSGPRVDRLFEDGGMPLQKREKYNGVSALRCKIPCKHTCCSARVPNSVCIDRNAIRIIRYASMPGLTAISTAPARVTARRARG
jgi:hypothetical protein